MKPSRSQLITELVQAEPGITKAQLAGRLGVLASALSSPIEECIADGKIVPQDGGYISRELHLSQLHKQQEPPLKVWYESHATQSIVTSAPTKTLVRANAKSSTVAQMPSVQSELQPDQIIATPLLVAAESSTIDTAPTTTPDDTGVATPVEASPSKSNKLQQSAAERGQRQVAKTLRKAETALQRLVKQQRPISLTAVAVEAGLGVSTLNKAAYSELRANVRKLQQQGASSVSTVVEEALPPSQPEPTAYVTAVPSTWAQLIQAQIAIWEQKLATALASVTEAETNLTALRQVAHLPDPTPDYSANGHHAQN